MKYRTTSIPIQKLLALILTIALSSACAAVDTQGKPGNGEKPRSDATPHLTINEKLTAELEEKKVEMLVTLDQSGKFVIMDNRGFPLAPCNDDGCSGLKDVTVHLIESPVILKTTRNPKCVVWYSAGQERQKCW